MHILTNKQLEHLTGYRQHAAQIRWLQRNGVRHYVSASGEPRVLESAVEAPVSTRKGPNLEAVRRAG